ncbi:3-dehydroquinate synthase [uncultured Shewanella sp.]|uniref:3-dehydroquinate synthase n=1 Tax=uncultured Shewanella sp. TaxID=173975 RepID=UPI0026038C77|nr:3-dehydroquinate synthase [uncultured Shewanella sp.]
MTLFRPVLGIIMLVMSFIIVSFFSFENIIIDVINELIVLLHSAEQQKAWISFFVIGALILDIIFPIPSSLVAVYIGTEFDLLFAAGIIWIGLTLGAILGYGLGRGIYNLFPNLDRKKHQLNKAIILSKSLDEAALILMRGIPVMAETSVIAAGLIKFSFIRFVILTSLANAGIALVYAYVGSQVSGGYSLLMVLVASIVLPSLALGIKCIFDIVIRQEKRGQSANKYAFFLKKDIGINNKVIELKQSESNHLDTLSAQFKMSYCYKVLTTENTFSVDNSILMALMGPTVLDYKQKVLCVIDQGVYEHRPDFTQKIESYFSQQLPLIFDCQIKVIQGGEACKTQAQLNRIIECMKPLDRHSWVIAIGGGALLDCIGFACAIFHRGIRLIRMPSTVLAQNDAGIGVKNGINFFQQKNFLGSFTPPFAVINDVELLSSLSKRDKRAGLAEAVKVALIKDPAFFIWLETNLESLNQFDLVATRYAIQRCAQCHIAHITQNGDPFERGNGRPLDYGHWSAHKMENLSDYQIRHGEAVAIGIVLDALYAQKMAWLSEEKVYRIINVIQGLGFELWHHTLDMEDDEAEPLVIQGLEEFRQHLGGKLSIPILTDIGAFCNVDMVDMSKMKGALKQLKYCSLGEVSC